MRTQRSASPTFPTGVVVAATPADLAQAPITTGPNDDQFNKAAQARVHRAEIKQSVMDVAQLAAVAMASTNEIKTSLRAEIGGLVITNGHKLNELRRIADDFRIADGKVTIGQQMVSTMEGNCGGTDWVAVLEANVTRSSDDVAALEYRMNSWTQSIVTVEAEVLDLEQHAALLAAPPAMASNIAALRAHASTLGSLTALEANLERQVSLLTVLRDTGVELSGSLTTHIDTLTKLLDEAQANIARSMEMMKLFIEFMVTGNPGQAAESYLRKQLSSRVQKVLYEAGVSPSAFADHLLKDADANVAAVLRPRLTEAFAAAMPAVFSTGDLTG
jgi:hypothetical protein